MDVHSLVAMPLVSLCSRPAGAVGWVEECRKLCYGDDILARLKW